MPFRRWLPNILLALAVAAFILPFSVAAQPQRGCAPLEYFTPLVERFPVFRILQGDKRKRAIALFNAIEPEQETKWQSAYLAIRPDGYGFLMVGMVGDICEFMWAAPDGVQDILRKIDGVMV